MSGPLYRFLADDHLRLDRALGQIVDSEGVIDRRADTRFRAGILRHIRIEEQVLFPFLESRGHDLSDIRDRIHLDHAAIAALVVPTPNPGIVAMIRRILEAHNPVEEGAGGLYETCEALAGSEVQNLLDRVRSVPEVRLAPHSDSSRAIASTRTSVERAGYRPQF